MSSTTTINPKAPTSPKKKNGLVFYPKSHRYKLDGQWVPGVTTILGTLNKEALPKWAAGQVAEYVADNPDGVDTLRQMGRGPMVDALKQMPWQKRDDAGTRGNVLHDYAEQIALGQEVEVDDESVPVIENVIRFMNDWSIEPVLIEAPVGDRAHQYAGTLDLIADYIHPITGHKGRAIFDWKSGKRIYPEYAMQMAAYAYAEFALVDGEETSLPECDAAFGVHIREDDYDVYPLEFGKNIHDEFLVIRHVYDIAKRMKGDWKVPGSGYVGEVIPHVVDTDPDGGWALLDQEETEVL